MARFAIFVCFEIRRRIFEDPVLRPKWVRVIMADGITISYNGECRKAWIESLHHLKVLAECEIITHNLLPLGHIRSFSTGLRSSGNGNVAHRIHSVKFATSLVTAWRDAPPVYKL